MKNDTSLCKSWRVLWSKNSIWFPSFWKFLFKNWKKPVGPLTVLYHTHKTGRPHACYCKKYQDNYLVPFYSDLANRHQEEMNLILINQITILIWFFHIFIRQYEKKTYYWIESPWNKEILAFLLVAWSIINSLASFKYDGEILKEPLSLFWYHDTQWSTL